jgi:hypothetical protein
LKPADGGYYICNAQNSAGRTRDYVYLEVNSQTDVDGNSQDREQQEREREQQEREREQQGTATTAPPESKQPKPLVIINSIFNGQPIEVGSDMKLVCNVNGIKYFKFIYIVENKVHSSEVSFNKNIKE